MKRQVNIEILRIVAMLMVLGLHANFQALHSPSQDLIMTFEGISRTFIQSLCICAVNTFVMISGWFGIKASLRGFCNFLWQVFYIISLSYLIEYLLCGQSLSFKILLKCFGLYDGGGWFVASYIGLYIISPILNSYIKATPVKNIWLVLLAFFGFEFLWGNTLSVGFIIGGYSTFSFIGIYVLAGLLRKMSLQYRARYLFMMYLICVMINTILYITAVRLGQNAIKDMIFNYINPVVIAASASLLLCFAKSKTILRKFPQNIILWLAASCFAAYLLHVGTGDAFKIYCSGVRSLYDAHSGFLAFIMIIGYILAVFFAAVVIDQPRKFIWRKIMSPLFERNA